MRHAHSVFGIDRTPNECHRWGVEVDALVIDAFAQLGIQTRALEAGGGRQARLVVDPDGAHVLVSIEHRSLVTDVDAQQFVASTPRSDTALLVVGDRVTDAARKQLASRGYGYLDLRGRLTLRTDRLVVEADIEPLKWRTGRSQALNGRAGLEVAAALLMTPQRGVGVRELAREVRRSASTVSEILAILRRDEVIDTANAVTGTELFWQVADRWPRRRTLLAAAPSPDDAGLAQALRLGLQDVDQHPGWALTDSAAAVAYGAPLAIRSAQMLDFFVPDASVLRRATTLLGAAATPEQATASVRVAPVPSIVEKRVTLNSNTAGWPLCHPVVVALDLAQDAGRGREILDSWTPDGWTRVW